MKELIQRGLAAAFVILMLVGNQLGSDCIKDFAMNLLPFIFG